MTIVRMLPCELDEQEVRRRQERLVTTLGEIEEQEEHFADLKREERSILKDLDGAKGDLLKQIRERKETRAVECEELDVFEQNTRQVIRGDTGAVIEERAMTVEERQGDLDLGDDGGGDA